MCRTDIPGCLQIARVRVLLSEILLHEPLVELCLSGERIGAHLLFEWIARYSLYLVNKICSIVANRTHGGLERADLGQRVQLREHVASHFLRCVVTSMHDQMSIIRCCLGSL